MTILNNDIKVEYVKNCCSTTYGNNVITLNTRCGNFLDNFMDSDFFTIHLNGVEIGYIQGYPSLESMHIEYIHIMKDYREKGYGTLALKILKVVAKSFNIKCIDAECRGDLKSFYKKLGADFKSRCPEDETYINNRFYIDL